MIYLLTGPIRSGKTTALAQWAAERSGVGGFLTPDGSEGRVLRFLEDGREHPFELGTENSEPAVEVGPFRFAAAAFARARDYLSTADDRPLDWIVVDELGKLELRGQGLEPELGRLIERCRHSPTAPHLLIVVRDSLLDTVRKAYRLHDARVVREPPRVTADPATAVAALTALWALSEAGLGGLLHLVRSPLTGIFVGGFAIVLIALLAHFGGRAAGRTILRALGVVLLVKALASPQSPPAAYLAVAFQGLVGAALFSSLRNFRLAAFLLGVLALLESSVQKILVLTLLFGRALWEAVAAFVGESAWWLVGLYVVGYTVAGGFIGWAAGRFPARIERRMGELGPPPAEVVQAVATPARGRRRRPYRRFLVPLLLLFVILAALIWRPEALGDRSVLGVILRTALALVFYFFVLGRLIRWLVFRLGGGRGREVQSVLERLPRLRALGRLAWAESAHLRGVARLVEAGERWVVYGVFWG